MDEESNVVPAEVESTAVVSTETESTPVSDPILDVLNDTESQPAEETIETEDTETAAESEAEQADESQEGEETQEEDKIDPKEEARKRYEERQLKNQERRQALQSEIQDRSEKYIKEGEDEYDQRLRAQDARMALWEADQYANKIEHNESLLVNEFERAKTDPELQIFNPTSEVFNSKAYDKALKDYNAGYISYDEKGNITGLKGSLYEHLKETADLLKGAVQSGAVQQVRATQRMRTTADIKPAATPKVAAKDPIMEILTSND